MAGPPRRGARAITQTLALLGLLVVVAILVYGDHARNGGWVGDAWVTRAWYVLYPHHDFFATVGHFLDLNSMGARPANAVYRVALNEWLGGDTEAWFAWQIASCVVMCLAVYALLREVGLGYLDAAAISALLLVLPASAALWLWSPIVHASLAIALGSVGFLLALRAFRTRGARRVALHLASLAAFVLSLLLYEVCLPLFLASVLLYALQAPRRQAVGRWLLDCTVVLPLALTVTSSSDAMDQGVGGSISHAGDMIAELPSMLFGALLPFGSVRAVAFVALIAIYIWALAAMRRRSCDDRFRARLRQLLAITAAGLALIALGYAIYVPGLDYYRPLATGIADRVNAVAGIGWTLCLYSLAGLIATLLTQTLRPARLYAGIATAALTVALGLSWLAPIADESRAYIAAYEEGERVLRVVERAVPDPPRGAAIWAFGQPVEAAEGVPVFANYWNMSAAVELTYDDRAVRGFVAFQGTTFECRAGGVVPTGHFEYPPPPPGELGRFGSRYGRTYFVDTAQGQLASIDSRARCLELRDAFPRAPQLPPGT